MFVFCCGKTACGSQRLAFRGSVTGEEKSDEGFKYESHDRRKILGLLGVGGIGLLSGARAVFGALPGLQAAGSASKPVAFPKGAIVRTILKDVPPEALASGSALFHEHLDGVYFLEAGYLDHLLLASDTRKDFGKVSRFVKQLQAAGVSEAMLHTIQVDNPRRFLAFVPRAA